MPRTIAIGDIHGCSIAFTALLEAVDPRPDDTLVTLGDYVNRGPDSKGVLDRLIALKSECRLIPLLGNHEEMLMANREYRELPDFDGAERLDSADLGNGLELFPRRHFEFLSTCQLMFETERYFFVHANFKPEYPLVEQDRYTLQWLSLRDDTPARRHCSGKTAFVGHTPQRDHQVLDLGHLVCVDTDCCHNGWLTAIDVDTRRTWQANQLGIVRGG